MKSLYNNNSVFLEFSPFTFRSSLVQKPVELMVGICQCTKCYHGQFQGKDTVNDKTFVLREVAIPEEKQREAVMARRPHFFLDLYLYQERRKGILWTDLSRVDVLSTRQGEKLYFGGAGSIKSRIRNRRWWDSKRPKQTRTIIKAMRQMLNRMSPTKRNIWLSRMARHARQ